MNEKKSNDVWAFCTICMVRTNQRIIEPDKTKKECIECGTLSNFSQKIGYWELMGQPEETRNANQS